jgi:hypothetical protein
MSHHYSGPTINAELLGFIKQDQRSSRKRPEFKTRRQIARTAASALPLHQSLQRGREYSPIGGTIKSDGCTVAVICRSQISSDMKMNTSAAVHHLKQETETPQMIGIGHVALSARDPVVLAEFYRNVLGL